MAWRQSTPNVHHSGGNASKKKRAHTLPLMPFALAIIKELTHTWQPASV